MKTNIAMIDGATNQKNVLFRMGAMTFVSERKTKMWKGEVPFHTVVLLI